MEPDRVRAGPGRSAMLSVDMDTVGKDTGIKPAIRDGVIYSDGTTILVGDDKSGVAAILEVIRSCRRTVSAILPSKRVQRGRGGSLRGAKLLDKRKLTARRGYVLDAGGRIGTIVTNAPSQDSLEIKVHGKLRTQAASGDWCHATPVASDATVAMPWPHRLRNHGQHRRDRGRRRDQHRADEVFIKGEARSRDNDKRRWRPRPWRLRSRTRRTTPCPGRVQDQRPDSTFKWTDGLI